MRKAKEEIICIFFLILFITFNLFLKQKPEKKEFEKYNKFFFSHSRWIDRISPDFEIELLNGDKIKISDLVGKKCIILNFFQTWCGPCESEIPYLNKFYTRYKDEKLIIIGLSDEKREKILEFLRKTKVEFPVGIDDKNLKDIFFVRTYPTTILIGAEGKITLYNSGAIYNPNVILLPEYRKFLKDLENGKYIKKEEFIRESKVRNRVENMILNLDKNVREICEVVKSPENKRLNLIKGCLAGDRECEKIIKEICKELKRGTGKEEIIEKFSKGYCGEEKCVVR